MKKKIKLLMLNKKLVSNLQTNSVKGGLKGDTRKCLISVNEYCNSDLCASHEIQTCTVTYEECYSELRFCYEGC
jgi:hypothetical protein